MESYIEYGPYVVEKPTSQWTGFYYIENGFNEENIKKVEELVFNNYKFSKGIVGNKENNTSTDSYETNNRDIAYIQPSDQSKWLYNLLFPLALKANKKLFHFDIDVVTDSIHYVIYPENGGHLHWHTDISAYGANRRKLAMTVQLSDPSEYEGGDFQIWMGGKEPVTVPRKKGDIIVFPTFLMHRVTPVTKGQRKCLVFWTGGKPFK